MSLRERDPADFDPDLDLELPDPPGVLTPPTSVDAGVPGFDVTGMTIQSAAGEDDRAVLLLSWDTDIADTVTAIAFEVRVFGQTDVVSFTTTDVESGQLQYQGPMPGTLYQTRAKPLAQTRITTWGAWKFATTPGVVLADVVDITFEHNDPSGNRVSWTAGEIRYFDANGALQSAAIAANHTGWTANIVYLYWRAGQSVVRATTTRTVAYAVDAVVLAIYQGGTRLSVFHGKAIQDAGDLKVGTLRANVVDTADFRAAGTAIFDGTLGSSTHDPNAPDATRVGWHISDDGSAEFNDLAVRRWIRDGAVSDGGVAIGYATPGRFGAESRDVPIVSKFIGPTTQDQFWHFACSIELSGHAPVGNSIRAYFRRRQRVGTVWSGWSQFYETNLATQTAWYYQSSVVHFNGVYDEVQIAAFVNPNRNLNLWSVDNVRNIVINARALMR